jgi:hypothetical protein
MLPKGRCANEPAAARKKWSLIVASSVAGCKITFLRDYFLRAEPSGKVALGEGIPARHGHKSISVEPRAERQSLRLHGASTQV